jgi:hypothetical protein
MKRIKTIEELKKLCKGSYADVFIALNYELRSSKTICWDETTGKFEVYHSIDGSIESLTEKQLMNPNRTNIGQAIKKGALFSG